MSTVSKDILQYTLAQLELLLEKFYSGRVLPGFVLGNPLDAGTLPDILQAIGNCHVLGIRTLAGRSTEEWMRHILRNLPGAGVSTFGSYRTAEVLSIFGSFSQNTLIQDFTQAEKNNILLALDSTEVWDPAAGDIAVPGLPNNFAMVMARCEWGRKQLGVLEDEAILRQSIDHFTASLLSTPKGFMDDSREGFKRYDIYTFEALLFCEPLWGELDSDKLSRCAKAHMDAFSRLAMRGGCAVTWGRSTGIFTNCLAMEYAAYTILHGEVTEQVRMVTILQDAFRSIREDWFADGLVRSHQHKSTYSYRGPHRILQTSFDCLAKLLYVAKMLEGVDLPAPATQAEAYPEQDAWIPFDETAAGVWCYRKGELEFQLPAVGSGDWGRADYGAWPRKPGVFEAVIESCRVAGLPKFLIADTEYFAGNVPDATEKNPGRLTLRWNHIERMTHGAQNTSLPVQRPAQVEVTYIAQETGLRVEASLELANAPQAVSVMLPETVTPFEVRVEEGPEYRCQTLPTDGMKDYYTFWNVVQRMHEIHFAPSAKMSFAYTIRL